MRVALADVLWEAANVHLHTGSSKRGGLGYSFSCHAVEIALNGKLPSLFTLDTDAPYEPWPFMRELGCGQSVDVLHSFKSMEEEQGVRYLFLLLAMHVAQDEQIMIEVKT